MSEYACGHNGKPLILDNNELTLAAYMEWKETVGFEGTKEKCFDCWCDEVRK